MSLDTYTLKEQHLQQIARIDSSLSDKVSKKYRSIILEVMAIFSDHAVKYQADIDNDPFTSERSISPDYLNLGYKDIPKLIDLLIYVQSISTKILVWYKGLSGTHSGRVSGERTNGKQYKGNYKNIIKCKNIIASIPNEPPREVRLDTSYVKSLRTIVNNGIKQIIKAVTHAVNKKPDKRGRQRTGFNNKVIIDDTLRNALVTIVSTMKNVNITLRPTSVDARGNMVQLTTNIDIANVGISTDPAVVYRGRDTLRFNQQLVNQQVSIMSDIKAGIVSRVDISKIMHAAMRNIGFAFNLVTSGPIFDDTVDNVDDLLDVIYFSNSEWWRTQSDDIQIVLKHQTVLDAVNSNDTYKIHRYNGTDLGDDVVKIDGIGEEFRLTSKVTNDRYQYPIYATSDNSTIAVRVTNYGNVYYYVKYITDKYKRHNDRSASGFANYYYTLIPDDDGRLPVPLDLSIVQSGRSSYIVGPKGVNYYFDPQDSNSVTNVYKEDMPVNAKGTANKLYVFMDDQNRPLIYSKDQVKSNGLTSYKLNFINYINGAHIIKSLNNPLNANIEDDRDIINQFNAALDVDDYDVRSGLAYKLRSFIRQMSGNQEYMLSPYDYSLLFNNPKELYGRLRSVIPNLQIVPGLIEQLQLIAQTVKQRALNDKTVELTRHYLSPTSRFNNTPSLYVIDPAYYGRMPYNSQGDQVSSIPLDTFDGLVSYALIVDDITDNVFTKISDKP